MAFKNCLTNKLWCLFIILCITKVCHAQLTCYVCENCNKVNFRTPKIECNEEYFNTAGTTDSSVQTTTEGVTEEGVKSTTTTATTTTTTTTTTTEMPTTTEETIIETTPESTTTTEEETTTETITTTSSTTTTEPLPPSPPTVGTPQTTTAIPTPPNPDTIKPIDDVEKLNSQPKVNATEIEQSGTKTYLRSDTFRIPQRRAISDVTYHCFKVQAINVNGTMITNRGCSRVATMESVCGKWQEEHPTEKVNRCYPCSNTRCNGSTALNVSITAMIVAVVAVFMHRK